MDRRLNALASYLPMLQPFDPARMQPQDVGLGGPSTEYLMTEYDQGGNAVNVPTIWWSQDGKPFLLNEQNALAMADYWETLGRGYFPRYNSLGAGVFHAMNRSDHGGASNQAIYKTPGNF